MSESRSCVRAAGLGILVVLGLVAQWSCVTSKIGQRTHGGGLRDGIFRGEFSSFPNAARVQVIIVQGRIVAVELLSHQGSWIGAAAEPVVPERIVRAQSSDVDAVSGATNSSHVIMNAVEVALRQARASPGRAIHPAE